MNERRALGFGLAAVLLWSTVATAFKLTLAEFSPIQMLTIASIVSSIALIAVCAFQGKLSQLSTTFLSNPWYYLLLGLVNPLAYYLILFKAYDLLPASQAQAINYSWAITLTLMAAVFLGQKIRKQDWIACPFSYAGVVVIATRGAVTSLSFSDPLGVAFALGSTLVWASYWIIATRDTRDPVVGLFLNFLFGLPFITLACWYTVGLELPLGRSLTAAVYVGVFEMGIAFVLWSQAMKKAENTAKVSNLIFISPFLSLVFIYFILGETIMPSTYVGLTLIMAGLWLQQQKVRVRQRGLDHG